MAPKKQKMSIHDFLNDTTVGGGSWADDVDDLPSAPTAREDRGYGRPSGLAGAPDRSSLGYSGYGGGAGGGADRGWPAREELPLPTRPPFTAFVGNLAFEVTEADIAQHFAPHVAVSIRLVNGHDGKPKGFGYVEFETVEGLQDALNRSGSQLAGRAVRVSVAEPPKEGFGARRGGRRDDDFGAASAAEEASQWRRSGPLPAAEPAAGGFRSGPRRGDSYLGGGGGGGGDRYGDRPERGFSAGPSGFDTMSIGTDGARAGFGSKFSAGAPSPMRGGSFSEDPALRRGGSDFRGAPREPREPVEPAAADVANDWRTGKPVSGPPPGASSTSSPRRGSADRGVEGARTPQLRRNESSNLGAELDAKYSGAGERMGFGSKFSAGPATGSGEGSDAATGDSPGGPVRRTSKFGGGAPGATPGASSGDGEATNWRTAPRKQPTGPTAAGGGSADSLDPSTPAAAPTERKRLELKPRSSAAVLDAEATTAGSPASSSSKASPFGAAKPVNAAEREREIEEKLETKREEERKEREAKRAEERERKAAAAAASAPVSSTRSGTTASTDKGAASGPDASQAADPVAASALANGTAPAEAGTGTGTDASASSGGGEKAAPAPAPTPRVPPPTGAWGGGRKASGALAKGGAESAPVDAVTEAVAKTSVQDGDATDK